jgi:hypothetical protein
MSASHVRTVEVQVRGIRVAAVIAWLTLALLVTRTSPAFLASRVAFLAALDLALTLTLGLGAYAMSFSLFADERYRGNLRRSLWQGGVTALPLVVAAALRIGRALSPEAVVLLVVVFVIGQIVVLLRQ